MTISKDNWLQYIGDLKKVNDTATGLMESFLKRTRGEDGTWNNPDTRSAVISYAYGIATKYGLAAAELACEMYDAVAKVSGVSLPAAEPAEMATMEETAIAVNGTMKYSMREDVVASSVGRLVKMAGADTALKNAIRDHAMWAWIPQGDTCAFCITLASNGWEYASSSILNGNHAEHIHPHCDCMFAIRHNVETVYEGYDPEMYKDMYDEADTDSMGWHDGHYQSQSKAKAKVNAMRRDQYAANKIKIRAQQNEAYEIRKEEAEE